MLDRFELATGLAVGTMGYWMGAGIIQTVVILFLTNLVYGFVVGVMGWDGVDTRR